MTHPPSFPSLEGLQGIEKLKKIMEILRSEKGCSWDRKQNHQSLIPYLIEETYEVVDALQKGSEDEMQRELGDLLLQIVFHCQIAKEKEVFDFESVAQSCCEMLIRRHPHVFASQKKLSFEQVEQQWQTLKKGEQTSSPSSLLDRIPSSMPAIERQEKMHTLAAKQGFDWQNPHQVMEKLLEEVDELKNEITSGNTQRAKEELGDVLMVCINLARHLESNLDTISRYANAKYTHRFQYIEAKARSYQRPLDTLTLEEWNQWWQEAKSSSAPS